MKVAAFAPAVFLVNTEGLTASATYRRLASDGTESSGPLYQCSSQEFCQPVPATPSARGSFVAFYATGFGFASGSNLECLLYDIRATVESAGPQALLDLRDAQIMRKNRINTEAARKKAEADEHARQEKLRLRLAEKARFCKAIYEQTSCHLCCTLPLARTNTIHRPLRSRTRRSCASASQMWSSI
jgi:hypothetical protein